MNEITKVETKFAMIDLGKKVKALKEAMNRNKNLPPALRAKMESDILEFEKYWQQLIRKGIIDAEDGE